MKDQGGGSGGMEDGSPTLEAFVKNETKAINCRATTKYSIFYATRLCSMKSRTGGQARIKEEKLNRRVVNLAACTHVFKLHQTLQQPTSPKLVLLFFKTYMGTVPPQLYAYKFKKNKKQLSEDILPEFGSIWSLAEGNSGLLDMYEELINTGVIDRSMPRLVQDYTNSFEAGQVDHQNGGSGNNGPTIPTSLANQLSFDPRKYNYQSTFDDIVNDIIYYDSKVVLGMIGQICPEVLMIPTIRNPRDVSNRNHETLTIDPNIDQSEVEYTIERFLSLHNFRQKHAAFYLNQNNKLDQLNFGDAVLPLSQRTYRQTTEGSTTLLQSIDLTCRDFELYYYLARSIYLLFPDNHQLQRVMVDIADEINTVTNMTNKTIPSPLLFGEFQDREWLQDRSYQSQTHLGSMKHRQQQMTFANVTANLSPTTNALTKDVITRAQGLSLLTLPLDIDEDIDGKPKRVITKRRPVVGEGSQGFVHLSSSQSTPTVTSKSNQPAQPWFHTLYSEYPTEMSTNQRFTMGSGGSGNGGDDGDNDGGDMIIDRADLISSSPALHQSNTKIGGTWGGANKTFKPKREFNNNNNGTGRNFRGGR